VSVSPQITNSLSLSGPLYYYFISTVDALFQCIIVFMEPSTRKLFFEIEALMQTNEAYITTDNEGGNFITANSVFDLTDMNKKDFLVSTSEEFVSEEPKVLIYIQEYFYHFFIDSLTSLLKLHNQHPSFHYVIYIQKSRPSETYDKFLTMLYKILSALGVTHTIIPTIADQRFAPVYKFKNYILIDSRINMRQTFPDIAYAADMAIKCSKEDEVDELEVEPYRRVYLTRGGAGKHIGFMPDNYEYYQDDIRMEDEWKLEQFFSDLGYEVINPEGKFESIAEQIRYMQEVKTLVSVTCSGLANMLFMKPNQLVIELQAELVQFIGYESNFPEQHLHNFYPPLSFIRGHKYLSIASNRDPDKVISDLTSGSFSYIL